MKIWVSKWVADTPDARAWNPSRRPSCLHIKYIIRSKESLITSVGLNTKNFPNIFENIPFTQTKKVLTYSLSRSRFRVLGFCIMCSITLYTYLAISQQHITYIIQSKVLSRVPSRCMQCSSLLGPIIKTGSIVFFHLRQERVWCMLA